MPRHQFKTYSFRCKKSTHALFENIQYRDHHHHYYQHKRQGDNTGDYININLFEKERLLFSNKEEESNSIFKKLDTERNVAILIQII